MSQKKLAIACQGGGSHTALQNLNNTTSLHVS